MTSFPNARLYNQSCVNVPSFPSKVLEVCLCVTKRDEYVRWLVKTT